MSNIDYALAYASMGWHIFPVWSCNDQGICHCKFGGKCKSAGKHPHGELAPRGHLDATKDEATIKRWYGSDSDAGIGVACDRSGLVVLDIDPRNGGLESLAKLEADFGPLKSNCVADTQGGGVHRIFRADKTQLPYPSTLGPGLDIKHHGYICVEPTQGRKGLYKWRDGHKPQSAGEITPAPMCFTQINSKLVLADNTSNFKPGSVIVAPQVYIELQLALTFIPPEIGYSDGWFKILQGLSRLHDVDLAHELARKWSLRSTNPKHTESDFEHKWKACMRESYLVSYPTVFYIADQYKINWRATVVSTNESKSSLSERTSTTQPGNFSDEGAKLNPTDLFTDPKPSYFDPDACLPPVVARWAKVHAQASGLEVASYAFASLPVLAASTDRSVRIDLGAGHNSPVIIWTAIVGKTGSGKSPAMNAAHKPLSLLSAEEAAAVDDAYVTWQQTAKKERSEAPPVMRTSRYVSDVTPEALGSILQYSKGHRVLLHYDEGSGWLNAMGQYSNNSDASRAFYLSSWMGLENHVISRVIRGMSRVPELGVNVLFGITPNKITQGYKEASAEGLLGRTLICLIDRQRHTTARPVASSLLKAVDEKYSDLVNRLKKINQATIFFENSTQPIYDSTRVRFNNHAASLEEMHPGLAGMLAKAGENLGRLAALYCLCDDTEEPKHGLKIQEPWIIRRKHLELATNFMNVAVEHASAAYSGPLLSDECMRLARECALKILRHQLRNPQLLVINRQDFHRVKAFDSAARQVQSAAIELLHSHHWLIENRTQRNRGNSYRFGEGSCWLLNPLLFDGRFTNVAQQSEAMANAVHLALKSLRNSNRG